MRKAYPFNNEIIMTNQPNKNDESTAEQVNTEKAVEPEVTVKTEQAVSPDAAVVLKKKSDTSHNKYVYGLIGTLIFVVITQYKQIDNLQKDSVWLAEQIETIKHGQEFGPKIAIMNFDDTVNEWKKLDPTGKTITNIMDNTVQAYNKKGYTIFDSKSIIGGPANMLFIDVTPNSYSKNKGEAE